jgi:cellulose synthase/poly-beta-1,6-N-acetylglucosamine synthase-like glycosyltransferase
VPVKCALQKKRDSSSTIFYGGNFAVRREALDAIGGFDTRIEFHGEDTDLGRRLFAIGKVNLQAVKLWQCHPVVCREALETLVATRLLVRTSRAAFARSE